MSRLNNLQLIDESLITITPINDEVNQSFDWVFFSSSNAVKSYFLSNAVDANIKYAAIGQGTAVELNNHIEPNFIGKGSTEEVAKQFKNQLLEKEKVLFPVSNLSRKTIQNHLDIRQVINHVSYQTNKASKQIDVCDVYVFTSPSNVEAFFELTAIPSTCKAIAIGKATKEELMKHDVKHIFEAWDYNNLALWDTI